MVVLNVSECCVSVLGVGSYLNVVSAEDYHDGFVSKGKTPIGCFPFVSGGLTQWLNGSVGGE